MTHNTTVRDLMALGIPTNVAVKLHDKFVDEGDVGGELEVTATGTTTARSLADRSADLYNIKDVGGIGDGVTDDTAAVTTAEASSAAAIYLPAGTYPTTKVQNTLNKRYYGEGILGTQTSKRGRYYSVWRAAPTSTASQSSVATAFDGDWSGCNFPIEHRIYGAATLGQPTTGYSEKAETSAHYTYLHNASGYNHATDSNVGRTGCYAYKVKVYQNGQGDAAAFNANVFVTGTKTGSTHFLANPAGVLFNGGMDAGADGVYLNAGEMALDDNGYDVAAIGWVVNLDRNNATGAKSAFWAGLRIQGTGTQFADAALSVFNKVTTGVDFATSTGTQALVMKAGQKIYGNATNPSSGGGAAATVAGTSYLGYDATLTGWEVVTGGNRMIGATATGLGFYNATPAAKPTVTGSRGGNAALASLITALATLGLITDSTTA
jgi:hypothetical protein